MMDMPLPDTTPSIARMLHSHLAGAELAQKIKQELHAYARAYAAAEVAKEREACAALCARFAARDMHPAECAAAIRAGSAAP